MTGEASRPAPWLWLAAAALFGGQLAWHTFDVWPAGLTDRSGRLKGADFLQFYTYGALAASGQTARLYEPEAHAEITRDLVDPQLALSAFRPNYPPVVAVAASPLASRPLLTSLTWFSVASWVCYVLAVAALTSLGRWTSGERRLVILAALACPSIFVVLRYGQISTLTLLILTAAVLAASAGAHVFAGMLLGLLAYKPNLLVVPAISFAVTGSGRLLAGLGAGMALEIGANLAIAGIGPMRQYVAILVELLRRPELVQFFPAESHSLRGFVSLLGAWPALADVFGWMGIVAAAGAVRRVWREEHDVQVQWAALVLAMLVASPHLLTYDLVLLIVPLTLLADRLRATEASGRWGRIPLLMGYFGAWPGVFIARLYHVQPSTIAMLWLLALAAQPRRTVRP